MNIIKKCYDKKVFLTTFLAMYIIHGARLFNVLCWHDDAQFAFRGWNGSLRHGRWLHHMMASIVESVSGHEILPAFSGIISALCIAFIACLLLKLFEIENYWIQLPLILIFCALPSVTGNFGYIGGAGYDFIGRLLCVVGAYILCKGVAGKKDIMTFMIASLIFACSLGEYQCYVAFYLTIILIYFTMEMLNGQNTWKVFWGKAIYYVGSAVVGLIFYLLILKIFLYITGKELTSYAGTDTFGVVNIGEYIERIAFAYKDFIFPQMDVSYNMFPFHWAGWHAGLLFGMFGLMAIVVLGKIVNKEYKGVIQSIITFCLIPLALNFNFIIYGADAMHSLHMYHYVLLFVYLFVLVKEAVNQISKAIQNVNIKNGLVKGVYGLTISVVFLFGLLYVRYDNYCYMSAEVRQEKAISYFTTLITRIQSVEGYDGEYSIAFINADYKKNSVDDINSRFDPIVTNPYNYAIINSYVWEDYMKLWCGFNPETVDEELYKENQMVIDMPSYPNDGAIQIIDEVIIVKF